VSGRLQHEQLVEQSFTSGKDFAPKVLMVQLHEMRRTSFRPQGSRCVCVGADRTPPLAQPAAAGRSAGVHPQPSVQRQPEDSAAGRVGDRLPLTCLLSLTYDMSNQAKCSRARRGSSEGSASPATGEAESV